MRRIYYIDVLRVLSTLAVIVLHIAASNWYGYIGSFNWIVFTVYSVLMRFSVPAFFMISGVLFLNEEKKMDIKRLFQHNIMRLAAFLFLWAAVYKCYFLIKGAIESGSMLMVSPIVEIIKSFLKGDTQAHLWFIYTIIGLYLIFPILKVYVNHAEKRDLEYFIILWFIFQCIYNFLNYIRLFQVTFQFLFINVQKLDLHLVYGYIGYCILGYYLHKYPFQNKKTRKMIHILGAAGVLCSLVITLAVCIKSGSCIENFCGFLSPGIVFWSISVFVLVQTHFKNSGSGLGEKIVENVSNCSLGIFGIHMLFVFLFGDMGISTFSFVSVFSVPVLSLLVFLCSWGTIYMLHRVVGFYKKLG